MKEEVAGLRAALRIVHNEKVCVNSGMESLNITAEIRTLDRVEQMIQWRLDAAEGKHHRTARELMETFANIRKDAQR